jgi:hypothetical protein
MCSFSQWFHYINTTDGTVPFKFLKSVTDCVMHHTDRADAQNLYILAVLKTLIHQCVHPYVYTDFQACFPKSSTFDTDNSNLDTMFVAVVRTWRLEDCVWRTCFCSMQDTEEISGFLYPYADSTLHTVDSNLKLCIKLGLCLFFCSVLLQVF